MPGTEAGNYITAHSMKPDIGLQILRGDPVDSLRLCALILYVIRSFV
jgi:hypothetical protein